ncbi:uncharacterized protein CDAR_199991 [Caerostris darwini]|uniref:Translation initiation factor IF-3, mitochondrial n=1 Tax=Caerostris darwini TaxID=1538125 RepID=A0AAV4QXY3_9ARAC|nr:uncharacterized protein CDAR_199991 [Caerostris darwini]
MLKVINFARKTNAIRCNISTISALRCEVKKKPKRKVSETVELVTLVDTNDKILGLKPKSETEMLARKLNLMLEKVDDPKYGKIYPAYKLVSSADLLKSESKTSTARTLKKLPLNSRISDHDLQVKIQTVQKWLSKNFEVHVAVTGNEEKHGSMKAILEKIQEELKDQMRVIDVRKKDQILKFILLPPKVPSTNKKDN